jgi:hypothetical protein
MNKTKIILLIALCIVAFVWFAARSYLTFGGTVPYEYGWRIRTGENPCVVIKDLWHDYKANEVALGIRAFETGVSLCPEDQEVKQILEKEWDTHHSPEGRAARKQKESGPTRGVTKRRRRTTGP